MMTAHGEKEQYIYVMSNPSYPDDILKIGWTREHPSIRANYLHTSGIPTPFIIEYVIITYEGSKLEKKIHDHLKNYRITSNREFFKISKEQLTEIITKDLTLKLTPITEINFPINLKRKYTKQVCEIKELYETLVKETDEFFSKMKKEKTELTIKEIDNKKHVSIIPINRDTIALDICSFDEDYDKTRIRDTYYFINKDINIYTEWVDELTNNYEELKSRIGTAQLRDDNKTTKKYILETLQKLHTLKNDYEWDF